VGQFTAKGGLTVVTSDNMWTLPHRNGCIWGSQVVDWSRIPTTARPFWQAVARELAETVSPMRAYAASEAARLWHRFLGMHNPTVGTDFRLLNAHDWGAFYEWALQQPNLRRPDRPLSLNMVRHVRSDLLRALQTAVILNLPGATLTALDLARRTGRRRFKSINRKTMVAKLDQTLSRAEVDRLYGAMLTEWHWVQDVLAGRRPFRPPHFGGRPEDKVARVPDVHALVGVWLSLDSGVRASELSHLRWSDVVVDESEHQRHRLHLRAGHKDEGTMPIDERTLAMLRALHTFTEEARITLDTDLLFVDRGYRPGDTRGFVPVSPGSLSSRINRFLKRHGVRRDDESELRFSASLGRRTFGAQIAVDTQNREKARLLLRHRSASTTDLYYVVQNRADLSRQVTSAYGPTAKRMAMAYRRPVQDLVTEAPEASLFLQQYPENDIPYGACEKDPGRSDQGGCRTHCFVCPLLQPETRKLRNFVAARDKALSDAQAEGDVRIREQHMTRAAQAHAYVELIQHRLAEEQ
jgi:integrase